MANQHVPVTGGCLCGTVRYKTRPPPRSRSFSVSVRPVSQKRLSGGLFQASVKITGSALALSKKANPNAIG